MNLPALEIQGLSKEEQLAFLLFASLAAASVLGCHEKRKEAGRVNSAWRGKGSFGRAPFGKQSSHR